MQILGWLLLTVAVAAAAPANAEYKNPMKFTIGRRASLENNIYADGEIDPDVAMRFATFLKEQNIPDGSYMVLNSPGGDLDAAFAFGKLLRAHKFQVDVGVLNPHWLTTGPQFEPMY